MFPLCFITDTRNCSSDLLIKTVADAVDAGARLIQYRDKNSTRRAMYENANALRAITLNGGATFLVNDQIDLALAVGADGVHLGQDDLPAWVARSILGKQAIIGISTHTLSEAIQAERDGADYIGFGPIFSTDTKTDAKTPVGIPAITEIAKAVRIPLYAIGGIGLPDLLQIFSAGATGVAAISAFTGDVQPNLRSWLKAIV